MGHIRTTRWQWWALAALLLAVAVLAWWLLRPWEPARLLDTTDAAYRVDAGPVAPDGDEGPGPALTVWLSVPNRPAATLLARMDSALSPLLRALMVAAPERFTRVRLWFTADRAAGAPWTKLAFETAVLRRMDLVRPPSPLLNLAQASPTPTGLARLADGCALAAAAPRYRSFCLRAAAVDTLPPGTPAPGTEAAPVTGEQRQ